jgi:RNA polymerase sigma factor (sigma-70 family)
MHPEPTDPIALRASLAELHAAAFAWAMACCRGDRARAQDVLHEAYVRVLEGRARFGERSTFKAWLFGVVRVVARETARRAQLRQLLLITWLVPDEPAAPPPAIEPEHAALQRAVVRLARRQREVIELVFAHDLTVEEAASTMGVGVGSARQHFARAKRRLHAMLTAPERTR